MKINRGNFEANITFLKKSKALDKSDKILEIGSGTGHMVKHLTDQGYNVTGTETNLDYIKFAKKEFGVKLTKLTGYILPFPDNSFDKIISFDVFEHIPDSDKHLEEVKRILKSNGTYAFSTPNILTNIPFEILKEKSLTKYRSYHPSVHSYWQLKSRLQNHGFESQFHKIPLVNKFFTDKIRKYLGSVGLVAIRILNPDKLPIPLRTNFYISAIFTGTK